MSTPRFFVDAALEPGAHLALPERVAHHALRVLRLAPGSALVLFNGRGGEAQATLEIAGPRAWARITQWHGVERESGLDLTLIQAIVAADKLDWVVEKATELGVARIVLVPAARSVVRLSGERLERRLAHWRDIALAACAQCGRNRVPEILAEADLRAACAASAARHRYVLAPVASDARLSAAPGDALALAVGPEGGFTPDELGVARAAGFTALRLGPRVLRTETAGLAALAACQALAGDWGASG
ncbi:MAG TPA: 16S rRNA (uracil(1498)-N(3))-methyltransferase [Burkholderiaceae bacterium]|nr:16S rRNA (uracil(1498)-N(3))-methyltransferase [Burkholderiaceae bacterium]